MVIVPVLTLAEDSTYCDDCCICVTGSFLYKFFRNNFYRSLTIDIPRILSIDSVTTELLVSHELLIKRVNFRFESDSVVSKTLLKINDIRSVHVT